MKSSKRRSSLSTGAKLAAVALVFAIGIPIFKQTGYTTQVVDNELVLGTTSGKLAPTRVPTIKLALKPEPKSTQSSDCDPSYRLQIGSKGSSVSGWQSYFNLYQGERLAVDGIFGEKTQAAVKRFQIKYGLAPSGIIEGKVCAKVAMTLNSKPSPKQTKK